MSTTPVPLPTWGQWRKEPITIVGQTIRPATFNEHDRSMLDERLGTNHDTKDNNDDNDRLPTN